MRLNGARQLAMQHQWDALFKRLVPYSETIKRVAERAYGVEPGSFRFVRQSLPTDIPSMVVSSALHWRDPFKELRADGMFVVQKAGGVVSFEYQTTHNEGMRLRFAMYMEALLENTEGRLSDRDWYNVLVYHGPKYRTHYREAHGSISEGYLNYAVVDLESIDLAEFAAGTLQDAILRLARRDAQDVTLFKSVLAGIRRNVSDAGLRAKLYKAVFVASLNKPRLRMHVWRLIEMDETFLREVEDFIPFFDELRAGQYKAQAVRMQRRGLLDLVTVAQGPDILRKFISEASEESIDQHDGEIRTAAFSGTLAELADRLAGDYGIEGGPSPT